MIGWSSGSPAAMLFWATKRETLSYVTGASSAKGNALCESFMLSRPSDGYRSMTDARTRGLRADEASGANLGQFTMHHYYRPRAHQIRCPRTFLRGGPPPPGPEQGFLLSAGEQLLLECWDLIDPFGDQAKPAEADLQSGPASPIHQEHRVN